jgi:hypothetical protein
MVHELLEARGKQGALEAGIDRSVVEAAAQYLSDEDNGQSAQSCDDTDKPSPLLIIA